MNKFGQTFEDIAGIFGKLSERKTMKIELRITAGLKNKIKTKIKNKDDLVREDVCYALAAHIVEALENKERIISLS